jgi:hypothetical protein
LYRKIRSTLKRLLVELNLFKTDSINNNNDQSQKRYQLIATRIYICVLIVSLVILTIYLALIPQTYVKIINNPTPSQFSDLYSRHRLSLQCPCSFISIPYNTFLAVEVLYHQICSSAFVSHEWTFVLLRYVDFMPSHGDPREFVQNGATQFLLLRKLCTEAKDTITNSLQHFLNQTLITTQVIPKENFESQATALIVEWKNLTSNTFHRTLQLIRATYFGNHLTAGDLNAFFDVNSTSYKFTLNSSIDFYGECNCMISPWCHSPLRVYNLSARYQQSFKTVNFFTGCFRFEALLKSNFECFYNQTCLNSIAIVIQFQELRRYFSALNATNNLPNETIESMVNNLFVDKWSDNISFENYFTICAPQSCTYEYTDRRNLILLTIAVISIFGGLSTLLKNIFVILLWLTTKVRYSFITFYC